jgi:hypothetical protein
MTPEQFFSKNMKWIALVLLMLLCYKSVQSCNRNMNLTMTQKQYIHTIDSLNTKYYTLEKDCRSTIDQLKFELKLQTEKAGAADKRADAVQSVAEKLKSNTTVNVRGAVVDSAKRR